MTRHLVPEFMLKDDIHVVDVTLINISTMQRWTYKLYVGKGKSVSLNSRGVFKIRGIFERNMFIQWLLNFLNKSLEDYKHLRVHKITNQWRQIAGQRRMLLRLVSISFFCLFFFLWLGLIAIQSRIVCC